MMTYLYQNPLKGDINLRTFIFSTFLASLHHLVGYYFTSISHHIKHPLGSRPLDG